MFPLLKVWSQTPELDDSIAQKQLFRKHFGGLGALARRERS